MVDQYSSAGLRVNNTKTQLLHHVELNSPQDTIHIDNEPIKKVDKFLYLGSFLSSSCRIDDEIQNRTRQTHASFGRLSERVYLNRNLELDTKILVYKAICLSTLLYGSETWTLYRPQIRAIESTHIRLLKRIMGVTWKDRIPHTEILKRTNCYSIEAMLIRRQFRWVGHVLRMPEHRLPRQVLCGELSQGKRSRGAPLKRFKDSLKSNLKACSIRTDDLQQMTADRASWRATCYTAQQTFERK